jgi:hypothetical protein
MLARQWRNGLDDFANDMGIVQKILPETLAGLMIRLRDRVLATVLAHDPLRDN